LKVFPEIEEAVGEPGELHDEHVQQPWSEMTCQIHSLKPD